MIYLDNAATTWPKPREVYATMLMAMDRFGANPGRGGHRMAMEAASAVYACREAVADAFGLEDPARVVFTSNCTMSLNMVIKGLLRPGDHVIVSDMEHNAVMRPLHAIEKSGISYSQALVCEGDDKRTVENFHRCLRPNTRLILCTHASNVFGTVLPLAEIGKLAKQQGCFFAVDGAQSGGILPINMKEAQIDFLCLPGHKGLYGPMGTGLLLCGSDYIMDTLFEGGTGSSSLLLTQPNELPDRFESGTLNLPGICGLHAGIKWLKKQGINGVLQHERWVMKRFYDMLGELVDVNVYTASPSCPQMVPLVSLNVQGYTSEQSSEILNKSGVAVRAGLHCAPEAHRHAGTISSGVVRFSPSAFTTISEVEKVGKLFMNFHKKPCNQRIVC